MQVSVPACGGLKLTLGIILRDSFTLFILTINPVFTTLTNVISKLSWGIPCLPSEDDTDLPVVYMGLGIRSLVLTFEWQVF